MFKENNETLNNFIERVVNNIDYEKIQKVMKDLDWMCWTKLGQMIGNYRSPSTNDIKNIIKDLINRVINFDNWSDGLNSYEVTSDSNGDCFCVHALRDTKFITSTGDKVFEIIEIDVSFSLDVIKN